MSAPSFSHLTENSLIWHPMIHYNYQIGKDIYSLRCFKRFEAILWMLNSFKVRYFSGYMLILPDHRRCNYMNFSEIIIFEIGIEKKTDRRLILFGTLSRLYQVRDRWLVFHKVWLEISAGKAIHRNGCLRYCWEVS